MTNTIDINGLPYMLIGEITVGTATTSVSFTGLDIGKDDDYLLVTEGYNPVATCEYALYANGNVTPANYYTQKIYGEGTTIGATRSNQSSGLAIVIASQYAESFTRIKLTNSGYFVYQSSQFYRTGSASLELAYATSTFTATSITSLTITSTVASAIGTGSRFQLYKFVAEKVADIIVATATTRLDILFTPINKNGEYLLVSDFYNPTSTSGYYLTANDNTVNTNYYTQYVYAQATTVACNRQNNPEYNGAVSGASSIGYTNIKLTNNGYIVFQTTDHQSYGGSSILLDNYYSCSTFTATEINRLTIISSTASAIGATSKFTLYKLK